MNAIKAVKQDYRADIELVSMMDTFRQMVNHCIRIGLENNITTLRKFSSMFYHQLDRYQIHTYYKLNAISQACGRLTQMKRSIKKGQNPRSPFVRLPYLVSCYGFKINGMLFSVPIGKRQYLNIVLNSHTVTKLSEEGIQPRSFIITPNSLSISLRKEIKEIKCDSVIGIDRNLRNITISIPNQLIMYVLSRNYFAPVS